LTFIAGAHGCIGNRFSIVEWVSSIFLRLASRISPIKEFSGGDTGLFILLLRLQDQGPLIYFIARVRVRVGPASGGHRTHADDCWSSWDRIEPGCGAAVAAADSSGEYGLRVGTVD
jgi:hypothetical protein